MKTLGISLLLLSLSAPAYADIWDTLPRTKIPGPVVAFVRRVVDGDTFDVLATPWPRILIFIGIRLRGVDTPEIRGKCKEERAKALQAKAFVSKLLNGQVVRLYNITTGSFAGRVIADVKVNGADLGQTLLSAKLARRYVRGGNKWCSRVGNPKNVPKGSPSR